MGPKFKVIALISGGKDSLFSILHCLENGHEVVVLANLYPNPQEDADNEDIDSYMYQTVGHSIIPLYAEVLGIPLYRQAIKGGAANADRDYAPGTTSAEEDETESLIPLLNRIKEEHPDVNAISTGAILSTYQRTRIESVAIRLNLVPLSFLWQYPYLPPYQQSSLLQDMRTVGQDARIIKVASGGLDESFLWQNVADEKVVRRLKKRMGMFGRAEGGAVLGEGGEFETLAISGPKRLWKGRIEVGQVTTVRGEGGSAVVRFKDARVVIDENLSVTSGDGGAVKPGGSLRIPSLLDDEFARLLPQLEHFTPTGRPDHPTPREEIAPKHLFSSEMFNSMEPQSLSPDTDQKEGTIHIPNITSPSGSPTEQMKAIVTKVQQHLQIISRHPSSIIASTLSLRNMDDFITINPIYGSLFTEPLPPSRVTIALGDSLPPQMHVVLSVIIDMGPKARRTGLHVQSRSYWAPANIGPYSQAITVPIASTSKYEDDTDSYPIIPSPRTVHVAGQIPLIPASMELVTPADILFNSKAEDEFALAKQDFIAQTLLSLQHLWRIGRTMEVTNWTAGLAFISSPSSSVLPPSHRAAIALEAWRLLHQENPDNQDQEEEEEPSTDPWDLRNLNSSVPEKETKDTRPLLPDHPTLSQQPPCFIIQISQLPRAAAIEWTSLGLVNCTFTTTTTTRTSSTRTTITITNPNTDFSISYQPITKFSDLSAIDPTWIEGQGPNTGGRWKVDVTVYTTIAIPEDLLRLWKPMVVPCQSIWGEATRVGEEAEELLALWVVRREAFPESASELRSTYRIWKS